MKTETPKQIAERIVKEKSVAFSKDGPTSEWTVTFRETGVIGAIEAALNAERERAAKIAKDKWMEMSALDSVESEHYARAGREIAAAIKGDKCPHGIYRYLTTCALCNAAIRGKR